MKRHQLIPSILILTAGFAAAQTAPSAVILQQYTFPPAGIAGGQTMRLNLANAAGGASVCTGNLSFINSDGTSIKNQDINVKAGQTVSLTLQPSDIAGSPAQAEVRGFVKLDRQVGGVVFTPGTPPTPSCSAAMSLEIVDSNGQTHVLLSNPSLVSGIGAILTTLPATVSN